MNIVARHKEQCNEAKSGSRQETGVRTGEDEEGRAVGDEAGGVQRDAVADGAHGVLAHSKAQVALLGGVLLEVPKLLHQRHVGGRQVGRATPEACAHMWPPSDIYTLHAP